MEWFLKIKSEYVIFYDFWPKIERNWINVFSVDLIILIIEKWVLKTHLNIEISCRILGLGFMKSGKLFES